MSGRGDPESEMQQAQTPPRPGSSITRSNPAVQIVDSAYQIVTMIGANPRAIRPILAQRRLTKEQVMAAAESLAERTGALLSDLDTIDARRRAQHEAAVLVLKGRIESSRAETPAEIARIQAELDAATAEFARFEAEQRGPRTYLTALRERAARVREVYQAL